MGLVYKRILVPIDFSDFSKNALRYSTAFAECFDSEIILIYVVEPAIYPPDFSIGQLALPTLNAEMDKRAQEELELLAKKEFSDERSVKCVVKIGKPFAEIITCAKEEDVDLIIISTHGHSGVEHILFGSTADKVVRKSPCPVLTLREPIKGFDYKEALENE